MASVSKNPPLAERVATIARMPFISRCPGSFMLVASTNPCPCGCFTEPRKICKCTPPQIDKCLARVSGPLIDRIDIRMEVPAVPYAELRSERDGTPSSSIRKQVLAARKGPRERCGESRLMFNGRMGVQQVRRHFRVDDAGDTVLRQAMNEVGLSA